MKKLIKPEGKAVLVFGGSSFGNDDIFKKEAEKIGKQLKNAGVQNLIYGGSVDGIMGTAAKSFKKEGGTVVEISTEDFLFVDRSKGTEAKGVADYQIVTRGLPARKHLMMTGKHGIGDIRLSKEADDTGAKYLEKLTVVGAIALPGGTGTEDEIYEVIVRNQEQSIKSSALKKKYSGPSLPFVIVNIKGVFDKLLENIHHKIKHGFTNERDFRHFNFFTNTEEAVSHLIELANAKIQGEEADKA